MIKQNHNKYIFIRSFLIALLAGIVVFGFLYAYNNKYTYKDPKAINGILYVSEESINENKLYFLTSGWAYYENRLLTPSDFKDGVPDTYMSYRTIGEYTSLSGGNSPYKKGTYVLNIHLPETERIYSLCLPEIFSAYKLYINNNLELEMGDIDAGVTKIQNRTITFNASGTQRIIIAVSDYGGVYGGMVYPPVFGAAYAVGLYTSLRLVINCAVLTFVLICLVLSLYLGFAGGDKTSYLSALLGVGALGSMAYPLLHSFFAVSGGLSYAFEIMCIYITYWAAMLLQNRFCGVNQTLRRITFAVGAAVCVISFVFGISAVHTNLTLCRLFSNFVEVYKWVLAIYLLAVNIYGIERGGLHMSVLIFGNAFFAVSLAFDRICSFYEPVFGGWFSEISCIVMLFSLGYVHIKTISETFKTNLILAEERNQAEKRIALQKESYAEILKTIEDTKRIQHDLRHHLIFLKKLIEDKEYDKMKVYLSACNEDYNSASPVSYSKNFTIDALLHYYGSLAQKSSVKFTASVFAPKELPVPDTDLCIIIGNLLENALEACLRHFSQNKAVIVFIEADKNKLLLQIENTYNGIIKKSGNNYISSKTGKPGIGVGSVKKTVEKYNGTVKIAADKKTFSVSLVFFYGPKTLATLKSYK